MASDVPTPAPAPKTPRSRFGLAVVGTLAVLLTTISAGHILLAVFAPPLPSTKLSCAEGTRELLEAVKRARERAAAQSHGERAALADFRSALEPQWHFAATIRKKCKSSQDKTSYAAYRAVELLRYAEERAVRYEAIDLSRLRQRAPQLVGALTSTSATPRAQ